MTCIFYFLSPPFLLPVFTCASRDHLYLYTPACKCHYSLMKAAVVLPKRLIYQSDLASVPENRTMSLPSHSGLYCDYYNQKGIHSVIMQAVADHPSCFTNIYIGWPGSVHDARAFRNSDLYRKGQNGSLDPTTGKIINGVPLVVLVDPAYPLLSWLMKSYTENGRLTPAVKPFNYRLS